MNARTWTAGAIIAAVAYLAVTRVAAAAVRRHETRDPDTEDLPGIRFYIRGRRIHLTIEGNGPPLLLLHGLGASGHAFHRLAPLLRDRYTLITPDLPGFGYSDRNPRADYSHEAQAALMNELLDRLEIDKVAIAGHSIGAAIALRLAAVRPERIVALVLAGGPGRRDRILPAFMRPVLRLILPLLLQRASVIRWLQRAAMAAGHSPDAAAIEHALALAKVRGTTEAWATILAGTHHGPAPSSATLPMPVLVICGASDRCLTSKRAAARARRFPDGRVAVIPHAGHLLLEEQPEQSAAAILTLLEQARP